MRPLQRTFYYAGIRKIVTTSLSQEKKEKGVTPPRPDFIYGVWENQHPTYTLQDCDIVTRAIVGVINYMKKTASWEKGNAPVVTLSPPRTKLVAAVPPS